MYYRDYPYGYHRDYRYPVDYYRYPYYDRYPIYDRYPSIYGSQISSINQSIYNSGYMAGVSQTAINNNFRYL